jgi:hypothetical protein
MKITFLILVAAFAVSPLRSQMRSGSEKSPAVLGNDGALARKTLTETGRLDESDSKTEFLLVPKKREGSTQTLEAWSFGTREIGPQEGVTVLIQIGEYEGRPVFLLVRVPQERGQTGVDDAVKAITPMIDKDSQVFDRFKIQKCSDGKKCVKSCNDKGKPYCCRYECIKKSP